MFELMLATLRAAYYQATAPTFERMPNSEIVIELLDAVNEITFLMKDEINQGSCKAYAKEKLDKAQAKIAWALKQYK